MTLCTGRLEHGQCLHPAVQSSLQIHTSSSGGKIFLQGYTGSPNRDCLTFKGQHSTSAELGGRGPRYTIPPSPTFFDSEAFILRFRRRAYMHLKVWDHAVILHLVRASNSKISRSESRSKMHRPGQS